MASGLVSHVHVLNPDSGQYEVFGPNDDLPAWSVDALGEHCFEGGKKPAKKAAPKPAAASK